jgi:hypothetical protein
MPLSHDLKHIEARLRAARDETAEAEDEARYERMKKVYKDEFERLIFADMARQAVQLYEQQQMWKDPNAKAD